MEQISEIARNLLPILGVVVLIGLIVLINNLVKVLKSVISTLEKTHVTIGLVDESIKKVQEPLDTVVKVSHTVDKAHDATVKAAGEAKDFVTKNAGVVIDKVEGYISNIKDELNKEKNLEKEPSPEDIIGG